MSKASQQRYIELGVTIALLIIAIVVSHVRLEGRVNLVDATNKIEHKHVKDKLDSIDKKLDKHLEKKHIAKAKEVACLKTQ